MGIFGDIIREVRDTIKDNFEECGFNVASNEVKDMFKALKGD